MSVSLWRPGIWKISLMQVNSAILLLWFVLEQAAIAFCWLG
jgi:hypothetical protein